MPPALHPRSRQTFSLFTTTLAVSFLVVGLPHILPCPVPHTAFADGDNPSEAQNFRQRRKREDDHTIDGTRTRQQHQQHQRDLQPRTRQQQTRLLKSQSFDRLNSGDNGGSEPELEAQGEKSGVSSDSCVQRRRECPVPKPGGLIGQVMGFRENENQKSFIPPVVEIKPRRQRMEDNRMADD